MCYAENHDKHKSRRIRGKDLNNAEKISPALSKHVKSVNGFVLPVGGRICAKCRRELSITIPLPNPWPNKRKLVDIPPTQTAPLPKRQKVKTRLSMDFVVYGLSKKLKKSDIRSDPNVLGIQNPEPENADLGQTRPRKRMEPTLKEMMEVGNKNLSLIPNEENIDNSTDVAINGNNLEGDLLNSDVMSVHEEKKQPLFCSICNKNYSDMPKHLKQFHKEIKAFICNICEYKTAQKIILKRHIENVHEGIKPFNCNNCDYKTALSKDLRRHIGTVHEGLKPFMCNICQYKSATKPGLNKHIKSVHEGIKPFECKICDYKNAQKSNLKRHVQTVHEKIKQFKCNLCEYKAGLKSTLTAHIKSVHEEIKPFKCHICHYGTATKSHLKTHIRLVHEKESSENKNNETKRKIKKYSQTSINIANVSQSAMEIYQASLGISNSVVKKEKETKYCDINNQEVIFPSIKVEHLPLKQSQMSDTADPLLIDEIKEEIFEENKATPIQGYSEVYIKQGEFGASEYQNEKENERVDLEIKEEPINPFVEYE